MSSRLCDVIIPTRNRIAPLQRCLRSLANQSARDFGIIIVDDHSDAPLDVAVAEVVASSTFDVQPAVIRLSEPSGPSAARNAGVAASDARFILFLDDDVVADRHLIEVHLSEVMEAGEGDVPIITRGPFVEPVDWSPTPWNLWEATMATRGTAAMVRGDYVPTWRQFHTGNNCLPTQLFLKAGGFNESYKRMEDDEFGWRLHELGCEIRFVPAALAWHYSSRSLDAWLAIATGYGHYTVVFDRDHPDAGYLEMRKNELARSNVLLRTVRALAQGQRRSAAAVALAVGAGRLAHRVRLTPVTLAAFSMAFDLSFNEAMRETEQSFRH